MTLTEMQADVRQIYRGGYTGPLISAIIWAAANTIHYFVSPAWAMVVLFFGGMLIFPLGTLLLRVTTGIGSLPAGHPSTALAMQSAFTVPLGLLVAVALGSYAPELFFPASLVIVGAHYFVFVTLYGARIFAVLGGLLATGGVVGIFVVPEIGAVSGWLGAVIFIVFTPVLILRTGAPAGSQGEPSNHVDR